MRTFVEAGVMGHAGARRAGISLALVTLTALALAGCAKSAEASSLPTPAVVWEKGEPTGAEWDSEWATAYRDAEIQLSAANVFADFSDPDLVEAVGYDQAEAEARTTAKNRFESRREFYEYQGTYAFWGAIVGVDEAADGQSAWVSACYYAPGRDDRVDSYVASALVTRNADGSHSFDRDTARAHPGGCEDAKKWVARWATPIDIDNVGRDSVRMPLPREYYVKLGVISE